MPCGGLENDLPLREGTGIGSHDLVFLMALAAEEDHVAGKG